MKITRLRFHVLLTGLCFITVLAAGLVFYLRFHQLAGQWDERARQMYVEYLDLLNKNTLKNTAMSIEKQFPILHDTELLKREAGTDWFWELSGEFTRIARLFGFAYIYYIEKTETGAYVFLLSSGIGKTEHPEWLGGSVWEGKAPAFIDDAWESRQFAFSPDYTANEWGLLYSVVLPIVNDGKTVGILGVDYDVSFILDSLRVQEDALDKREETIERLLLENLAIFAFVIFLIMCVQMAVDYRSVLVPIQTIEANERTRLMMDATPMACSIWNTEGVMLDCNREALNMLGLSTKADYIERFFDHCPEFQSDGVNSREKVAMALKAAFETGRHCFEWTFLTDTGELLPVETTMVRVPWKDGARVTVYARDLREIKAKEEAARETEERLRIMLDEMAFSCVFYDEDGKAIDCNRRAVSLFRSTCKQDLIDNIFRFSPEFQSDGRPSGEKGMELIRDTFRTGKNSARWDHIRGDGSPLPTEVTMIRVKWKSGYRVVAYIRDLTDLVETRDNLIRITSITEGSPSLILYIGAEGMIEYMNPAASAIGDPSREALLAETLRRVSPNGIPPRSVNEEGIRDNGKKRSVQFEIPLAAGGGERRDFVFFAFPTRLHDGRPGIGLLGRDITDLKEVQRDLIAAKEQAERAWARESHYNKIKSDFLSRVSHEMRTPLNAIIGMTSIAQKSSSDEERERCYNKIEDASRRLLGIVNDILDMTGIDTGGLFFFHEPFSFSEALRPVIAGIESKAAEKGLRFVAVIDENIPDRLVSDERRLQQILTNLLSNAVKFTGGAGKVEFSAQRIEDRGSACLVRFEISDTGVGITEEARGRIWDPFEQADTGITREYGGIGLSLSLTKRIVGMMNGEIRVESEPGEGSRFICDLLFGVDRSGVPSGGDGGEIPDLAGRKILVVDDVDINREMIFALLEDTGAELEGAAGGGEAVALCSQKKYDLVFMDLHMPGMDGLDAARGIRAAPLFGSATTPIIALTADNGAEIRARCREAGLNDYLTKPVDAEILFKTIARWLPRLDTI
ncbi:MAG: response regulator [Treponema sp.]|nr:response regulator [Treponema sp.]